MECSKLNDKAKKHDITHINGNPQQRETHVTDETFVTGNEQQTV